MRGNCTPFGRTDTHSQARLVTARRVARMPRASDFWEDYEEGRGAEYNTSDDEEEEDDDDLWDDDDDDVGADGARFTKLALCAVGAFLLGVLVIAAGVKRLHDARHGSLPYDDSGREARAVLRARAMLLFGGVVLLPSACACCTAALFCARIGGVARLRALVPSSPTVDSRPPNYEFGADRPLPPRQANLERQPLGASQTRRGHARVRARG